MEVRTKSTALRGSGRIHKELTYWTGEQSVIPKTQQIVKLDRRDILATSTAVPRGAGWAKDLPNLAFAIEHGGLKSGNKIGTIHQGTIPSDFTRAQAEEATQALAKDLAKDLGVAAVSAVHDKKVGRAITRHFHLFTTAKEVTPEGVGKKVPARLPAEKVGGKAGETVNLATYVQRKWKEQVLAIYEAAKKQPPDKVDSGELRASQDKRLRKPREYPDEILKQVAAVGEVAQEFTTLYKQSLDAAEKHPTQKKNLGHPLQGPMKWQDREALAKNVAGVFHTIKDLQKVLMDASQAGGFGLTAEKRRFAPEAAQEREKQARLTSKEKAREERGMQKMRNAGDTEKVMELAVKGWEERVSAGRPANIGQIMNRAMNDVAAQNKKDGGRGR